jgi:molybdopterin converting factor subunit 1
MHHIKIFLFATLRDYVGAQSIELDIPNGTTVAELEEILVTQYPRLEKVRGLMMAAINRIYAADEQIIPADAEIAFFPPVSGG